MEFYTSQGNLRPELMDKEAAAIAGKILSVKPTQMRRIFDQIKQLQRRLDAGETWEKIEPLVRLQKAQLAYTVRRGKKNGGRQSEPAWDALEKFLFDGIDSVKTRHDYGAFCNLMEAVYAFHYARTPERV